MLPRNLQRKMPETKAPRLFRSLAAPHGERPLARQFLHRPIRLGKAIRQDTDPAMVVMATTAGAMVVMAVADHMAAMVGAAFSAGFSTDRIIVSLLT